MRRKRRRRRRREEKAGMEWERNVTSRVKCNYFDVVLYISLGVDISMGVYEERVLGLPYHPR